MPGDCETAIEVRSLAKRFDAVQAVAGIDFDVCEGEAFGFLGPKELCGRIGFIVEGRLVRVDTLANLMKDAEGKHVVQLALTPQLR